MSVAQAVTPQENHPTHSMEKTATNTGMVIESHLEGKISEEKCEDGIIITNGHVAVIDGSTSKSPHSIVDGMSNGRAAMLALKDIINRLHPSCTLSEFCSIATSEIMDIYHSHGISVEYLKAHPEGRLTASVAILSLSRREVWLIGDCQCLADGIFYDNPKPAEAAIANHRSEIITDLLSHGKATVSSLQQNDIARDAIVGDIVKTCFRQNIDFATVDGFPIAEDKVKVVQLSGCHEVVLATDGYPFLLPTLKESEEALARQLSEDPLCDRTFKATKGLKEGQVSFDDRAYVRICL